MGDVVPAPALAGRLHAGQTDKRGRPYLEHLEVVVEIVLRRWSDAPPHVIEAAWLHDTLEDTEATARTLRDEGVSGKAIELIRAVTRDTSLTYQQWIWKLAESGNQWAIRLKLADIEHNSDPARRVPGSDMVERRYEPARRALERALMARGSDHA